MYKFQTHYNSQQHGLSKALQRLQQSCTCFERTMGLMRQGFSRPGNSTKKSPKPTTELTRPILPTHWKHKNIRRHHLCWRPFIQTKVKRYEGFYTVSSKTSSDNLRTTRDNLEHSVLLQIKMSPSLLFTCSHRDNFCYDIPYQYPLGQLFSLTHCYLFMRILSTHWNVFLRLVYLLLSCL